MADLVVSRRVSTITLQSRVPAATARSSAANETYSALRRCGRPTTPPGYRNLTKPSVERNSLAFVGRGASVESVTSGARRLNLNRHALVLGDTAQAVIHRPTVAGVFTGLPAPDAHIWKVAAGGHAAFEPVACVGGRSGYDASAIVTR